MLVAFINSFLSYLLLVLIIVALGGIAIFLGITLRKRKNAKEAALHQEQEAQMTAESDTRAEEQ